MPDVPLWRRHERDIAELLGGWVTVGSGAGQERLDVRTPNDGSFWRWMVECKSTSGLGFRVTQSLLSEIRNRTYEFSDQTRPALALRFYGPDVGPNTAIMADQTALSVHDLAELLEERERLQQRVKELEAKLEPQAS